MESGKTRSLARTERAGICATTKVKHVHSLPERHPSGHCAPLRRLLEGTHKPLGGSRPCYGTSQFSRSALQIQNPPLEAGFSLSIMWCGLNGITCAAQMNAAHTCIRGTAAYSYPRARWWWILRRSYMPSQKRRDFARRYQLRRCSSYLCRNATAGSRTGYHLDRR